MLRIGEINIEHVQGALIRVQYPVLKMLYYGSITVGPRDPSLLDIITGSTVYIINTTVQVQYLPNGTSSSNNILYISTVYPLDRTSISGVVVISIL